MENKKKKSTGLLLSILGVISLVLITAGVTYAFFSYAKQGVKENTISTGSITFVYNENDDALNITDALPKADSVGMGEANPFTFTVTSTTPSTAYINYIVTVKKQEGSTLPDDQIKLYLTSTGTTDGTVGNFVENDITGTTAGNIKTFADLADPTTGTAASKYTSIFSGTRTAPSDEYVIYAGQVPQAASSEPGVSPASYSRTFSLRMWLAGANGNICVNYTGDTRPDNESACTAANGKWVPDTTGMADYSAFEFVKKSAVSGTSPILITGLTEDTTTPANGTWMRSVPYYAGINASPATVNSEDWERIAYVNYKTKQIYTVSQVTGDNASNAPTLPYCSDNTKTTKADCDAVSGTWTDTGWEASEQYYPLNGGTFKIKVNVYAEGATTYSLPASPSNNP